MTTLPALFRSLSLPEKKKLAPRVLRFAHSRATDWAMVVFPVPVAPCSQYTGFIEPSFEEVSVTQVAISFSKSVRVFGEQAGLAYELYAAPRAILGASMSAAEWIMVIRTVQIEISIVTSQRLTTHLIRH